MDLQQKITELATEALPDPSLFIVSVDVSTRGKTRVGIFIDGDQGVSIDQCARVSRYVGNAVEEMEIIEQAYQLEVSSPGIDAPLTMRRQFPQHVGRRLQMVLQNGTEVVGALKAVSETHLSIEQEVKQKGKKKPLINPVELAFDDVREAKVLVSF